MFYEVFVLPSAERELGRIPRRDQSRILNCIEALRVQPRPIGMRKLRGQPDAYRLRQGDYRILYRVDDSAWRVFVYAVGNRKDVYR